MSTSESSLLAEVAQMGERALVGKTASELRSLVRAARVQVDTLIDASAPDSDTKPLVSEPLARAFDVYEVVVGAAERQRAVELLLAEGRDGTHLPDGVSADGAEALARGMAEAVRLSGLPSEDVVKAMPAIAPWVRTVEKSGLWGTQPDRFKEAPWGGRIMSTMETAQALLEGRLVAATESNTPPTDVVGTPGVMVDIRARGPRNLS